MNLKYFSNKKYKILSHFMGGGAAFLFFSVVISSKSGHSIAIILALIACLLLIPTWIKEPIPKEIKAASFFFLFLAFFWSHTFDYIFSFGFKGDHFLRYFLGVFFVIGFGKICIRPRKIIYGMAVGCFSSGVLALWQYIEIGRAEGFTNAIRFGNIALLMGIICLVAALFKVFSSKERCFFFVCGFSGILASIFSLSRGGWPLFTTLPFIILFVFKNNKKIAKSLIFCLLPIFFVFIFSPPVNSRFDEAKKEIVGYFYEHDKFVNTSVGARLEQWKTAVLMGMEKPITGWGDRDIKNGKMIYVEKSISDPSVMQFNHAHNDFLESWARKGVIGVFSVFAIYVIPIFLIISSYKSNKESIKGHINLMELNELLMISGVLIYFGYFIFGLSDVFFNFAIGHNFYLFSLIFILSAMQWIKKQIR